MEELRNRVLIPFTIPLAAAAVIVIVVLNFSRVLLALEERGSATAATLVAIAVASAVLFGSAYATARGEERSTRNLTPLAMSGMALALAGIIGVEAIEEERREAPAEAGGGLGGPDLTVTAGPGLVFGEPELSAAPGDIVVEYTNADTQAHTLVFEDAAPGFKLEVGSRGDTDKGKATLEAGTYTYYCDIPGHRPAGMEGTLTVAEGAGRGGGDLAAPQSEATVDMTDALRFKPPEIVLQVGGKVTWKNSSTVVHTATGDPAKVADASHVELPEGAAPWNSDLVFGNGSFTQEFTVPGTYRYACIPHENVEMFGTIEVVP